MKILIYGAGVIGSIYAAKLKAANCDVTLLARDKRYENLKQNGIIINNVLKGKQTTIDVPLTQLLKPTDYYDLIIVAVRLDQLEAVIPALKQNMVSPLILFLLNNPDNIEQLINALPQKHIILGFPGVGGTYHNESIDYVQIKQQETTIGEVTGKLSEAITGIKTLFEKAGLKVKVSFNMQAWLKTHAVFITCVSAAISKEHGDSVVLGKNKRSVTIMVKSIVEGFIACKKLGMSIKPTNLDIIFMIMPRWFSILYWQRALQGITGRLAIAPHANAAKGEMQLLAKKVLTLVHSSAIATPTLDDLLSEFINSK